MTVHTVFSEFPVFLVYLQFTLLLSLFLLLFYHLPLCKISTVLATQREERRKEREGRLPLSPIVSFTLFTKENNTVIHLLIGGRELDKG